VVVFFLAFWLLGAIINRGRWGHWVIFGLLVGAASYGGHLLGQLFQAPFWQLTGAAGAGGRPGPAARAARDRRLRARPRAHDLVRRVGGGARRRISELNREAQREYERTLEAGPRIQQG
jgi:hypothetical protein